MICYSISDNNFVYCTFISEHSSTIAVELRLDLCQFPIDAIKEIYSNPHRLAKMIATYRIKSPSEESKAVEALSAAILAGADMVDLDISFPEKSKQWVINLARNMGCEVILSYHNFTDADTIENLRSITKLAFTQGADIAKIVTTAYSYAEGDIVFSLYNEFPAEKIIAFAMGEKGRWTRASSSTRGAPLFYMSPSREMCTAPGQYTVYDFTMRSDAPLRGEALIPASKSIAQRAILLAALAQGATTLYNFTLCDDTQSALSVAYQLGAEIDVGSDKVTIIGHQEIPEKGLVVKDNALYVGESALLARLCIPLAALSKEKITIYGEKSLLRRTINEHHAALKKLGLKIEYSEKKYLPVTVSGNLNSIPLTLKGKYGSQMISGILLARSLSSTSGIIQIEDPTSEPYLDLTTEIASYFGIHGLKYDENMNPEETYFVRTYKPTPWQRVKAVQGVEIEKDWSAAALFMAAGAIMGDITINGMDVDSLQADADIITVLENSGADILYDQKTKSINVRKSLLCPFFFDITNAPDLFAPLFLLAIRTHGVSCIKGISRLKNKESDRASTFRKEFSKLGLHTKIVGDEMHIWGHSLFTFEGGRCSSHGDHRLAMVLCLANMISKRKIIIDDVDCIAKSFPSFLDVLKTLKRRKR